MDNKKLLYILAGLALLYAFSQFFNKKKDSSFESEFVKLDTSGIDKLVLHSQADGYKELVLSKDGNTWFATQGNKKVKTEYQSVNGLLQELVKIKIKSIATQSKDRLKEYEIEDGKGSKVAVYSGSKKLADFVVGKFGFNQQAQSMISYLRKAGEDKVYAVDGFQSMTFNTSFSNFRDKTISKINAISKVNVSTLGKIFELANINNQWLLNNNAVSDSNATKSFVNGLLQLSGSDLVDDFIPASPIHAASITDDGGAITTIKIYASQDSTKPFIIESSANEKVYFKEDSNGVYNTLIKGILDLTVIMH